MVKDTILRLSDLDISHLNDLAISHVDSLNYEDIENIFNINLLLKYDYDELFSDLQKYFNRWSILRTARNNGFRGYFHTILTLYTSDDKKIVLFSKRYGNTSSYSNDNNFHIFDLNNLDDKDYFSDKELSILSISHIDSHIKKAISTKRDIVFNTLYKHPDSYYRGLVAEVCSEFYLDKLADDSTNIVKVKVINRKIPRILKLMLIKNKNSSLIKKEIARIDCLETLEILINDYDDEVCNIASNTLMGINIKLIESDE